ncbi:hypothetical protein GCM10010413_44590 [Promicromonospora sukumoe]
MLRHLVHGLGVEVPRAGPGRDRVGQGVPVRHRAAVGARGGRDVDERGDVGTVQVPPGDVGRERGLVPCLVDRGAHQRLAGRWPAPAVREAEHAVDVLRLVRGPERRGQHRPEPADQGDERGDQRQGSAVRNFAGIVTHALRIGVPCRDRSVALRSVGRWTDLNATDRSRAPGAPPWSTIQARDPGVR